MNEEKQLFTEERIAQVLDSIREAEPEQVVARIMEEIVLHRGSAAQSDDITMLCFKYLG
jgi:sigma-B regulation protein RsbU (phosphoserine phosphatase)